MRVVNFFKDKILNGLMGLLVDISKELQNILEHSESIIENLEMLLNINDNPLTSAFLDIRQDLTFKVNNTMINFNAALN